MNDVELDEMVRDLSYTGGLSMLYRCRMADAITTLRAKFAAETARADRAEAERAAQIEADAGIVKSLEDSIWDYDLSDAISAIRAQPHSRTALDRYREKVLREAADKLKGQGYNTAVRQILALIGEATP